MAEVIGLISGLMTIANAGLRLYKTLDHLADGIKSAEEDITLVALDLKATTSVVGAVRECLNSSTESRSLLIQRSLATIPGLTDQCSYVFQKIHDLVSYLEPYHDRNPSKDDSRELVRLDQSQRRFKLLDKWKWQQQKPKVDILRSYLESLKTNLSLLLSLLNVGLAEERREPEDFQRMLRKELREALHDASACRKDLDSKVIDSPTPTRSTSLVLVKEGRHTLRPQRAVQDLARELVLWSDSTEKSRSPEPEGLAKTLPYHPRTTHSGRSNQGRTMQTEPVADIFSSDAPPSRGITREHLYEDVRPSRQTSSAEDSRDYADESDRDHESVSKSFVKREGRLEARRDLSKVLRSLADDAQEFASLFDGLAQLREAQITGQLLDTYPEKTTREFELTAQVLAYICHLLRSVATIIRDDQSASERALFDIIEMRPHLANLFTTLEPLLKFKEVPIGRYRSAMHSVVTIIQDVEDGADGYQLHSRLKLYRSVLKDTLHDLGCAECYEEIYYDNSVTDMTVAGNIAGRIRDRKLEKQAMARAEKWVEQVRQITF